MSKKIVIASDSFKGSASSLDIGRYISEGITALYPDYKTEIFSIADGGEGTVEAILNVCSGELYEVAVSGPLGDKTVAKYGIIEDGQTAVIEMAEASGITLVEPSALNIMQASTYGTGELILAALANQVSKIYIGVGGSATNDGGMGMAAALGVKFYDSEGQLLIPVAENLNKINSLDMKELDQRLRSADIIILSDVTNPLCGPQGASAVYGPQKGATPEQVKWLDQALNHYAEIVAQATGNHVENQDGAGAAGGLGYGLMAFLNAKLKRGVDTILEIIQIESSIQTADLVITGEGRMDSQSMNGKAPLGIARIAQRHHVPTFAIVGSASTHLEQVYQNGISGVFDIVNRPMTLEEAIAETPDLVRNAAKNLITIYRRLDCQ